MNAMDFFTRQDVARKRTKWLVLYFILAVIGIIAAIYLVFTAVFLRERFLDGFVWSDLWHLDLFLGVSAVTCLIVLGGSLAKWIQLRQGGGAVARSLGGRLIHPETDDADERKLLNIVEEMALASGMPVPEVYILTEERGVNAFAAGNDTNDAAIGVTRGAIRTLNRDELQGVIAHEFSHILNGDMRLNLRLMGVINGILAIAIIGRVLLYTGGRSRHRSYCLGASSSGKGGNPLPFIGIALLAIGYIGVFFGRMIKSAVSRQREFLADASAVQFTRNPAGIAGALKKIGGLSIGSRIFNPHAEEASHLLFGNGLRSSWIGLMATHPPLDERIRAIDPGFDGTFPEVESPPLEPGGAQIPPELIHKMQTGEMAAPQMQMLAAGMAAHAAIGQVGSPQPRHLEAAVAWRDHLGPELERAAHSTTRATRLIYALLLSREDEVRQRQLTLIDGEAGEEAVAVVMEMVPHVDGLAVNARLPLAEISLTALRHLTPEGYAQFRKLLGELVEADRAVDLFEFALQRCVLRHLAPHFEPRRRRAVQFYSLRPLIEDCVVVISLLANVGHVDAEGADAAFEEAMHWLGSEALRLRRLPNESANLQAADEALDKLAQASPAIKKRVLNACAAAVASDGEIAAREAELLRAVADSLDCPIPPNVALDRAV